MAKKQSPPPPSPHSPHKISQNPNPNLMAKKQTSPPPNPNQAVKKQPSPPPNPKVMAKKQASPPPNPNQAVKKQPSPPPNANQMVKKQPSPPSNPNQMAKKQPYPPNPNLMAKKQPPPPPNNPNLMVKKQPPRPSAHALSSSSEDEESSSASNDEEAIIKKPNTQTPTNNQEKEEEETGYETESESSDDEEGEEVNQPETKRPQPISTTAAIPALNKPCDASKKPNGKDNANNEDDEGESDSSSDEDQERRSNTKKPQAISMTAASPALKPCDGGEKPNGKVNASGKFRRIWSLEDEIGILKAITKFEVKHGPIKINMTAIRSFHDFVKDSLSLEVSDSQLYEKVRRLRRKYKRRANRGNTIKFWRAHDEKVYELSKKIWGTGSSDNTEAKKVAKSKRAATVLGNDGTGSGSLKRKYPFLRDAMARSVSAELLETVVDPENVRLLEVKFKKQKVAEINNKKCEMKLMVEALEKVLEDIENATTE